MFQLIHGISRRWLFSFIIIGMWWFSSSRFKHLELSTWLWNSWPVFPCCWAMGFIWGPQSSVGPSDGERAPCYLCLHFLISMPSVLEHPFSHPHDSLWKRIKATGKTRPYLFNNSFTVMNWWYWRFLKNNHIRKAKTCHRITYHKNRISAP